jgi:hypothetical protein
MRNIASLVERDGDTLQAAHWRERAAQAEALREYGPPMWSL